MARLTEFPSSERGAALLSVLLLVAILSVIAATTLDRVILATRQSVNGQAMRQAKLLAFAAEDIALAWIADLKGANPTKTVPGDWLGVTRRFQLPGGSVSATVHDGGNCFNLNSLVKDSDGQLVGNPIAHSQFLSLMAALSIPENLAKPVADAALDWADSDRNPQPGGAEDGDYQSMAGGYLAANRLYAHESELRGVKYVTPALYEKLEPFLCALPTAALSPINVNTLRPEQSVLLAMFYPANRVRISDSRAMVARRPQGGYGSTLGFWDGIGSQFPKPDQQAQDQVKVTTDWFRLELKISSGNVDLTETALVAAETSPPKLIWRNWGEAE